MPTSENLTNANFSFHLPLVSRERFAELVGLPVGVIVGFINKGYLPTVTIGKYSLVNVEALRIKAAEKAQEFTL
jgi:hypothetical protein